jgi:hypothetical protein
MVCDSKKHFFRIFGVNLLYELFLNDLCLVFDVFPETVYPFLFSLESGSPQPMGKQAAGFRKSTTRNQEVWKVKGTLVE